ncbi:MAG: hypothetical protein ACM35G_01365 [Planctomycetaceae bacterium]
MSFWTLLFIAVGISADAFAVALGKGLSMRRLDMRAALAIAGTFGLFQGLMPLWVGGSVLSSTATSWRLAIGLPPAY